jgi:hypothetical protein
MPDSTPGAWIGIAIIAVTLVEVFAHGPLNQNMPTPLRLKDMLDSEGGLRRILMADCTCEAVCPRNNAPENIGVFSAEGLCTRATERDSLLQVISHSNITDLIITGCDSSPLPPSFKQSLQSLHCDLRGLDLMRIANSRTIIQEPIGLDADLAKASIIDPWSQEVVEKQCCDIITNNREVEFLISTKPPPFGLQMRPDQAWLQIDFSAELVARFDAQAVRYRLI